MRPRGRGGRGDRLVSPRETRGLGVHAERLPGAFAEVEGALPRRADAGDAVLQHQEGVIDVLGVRYERMVSL